MDVASSAYSLYEDLGKLDQGHPVEWPLGQVFNVILAAAKEKVPDNPIVAAIQPLQQGGSQGQYASSVHVGTVRTLAKQIFDATDTGPHIG